MKAKDYAEKYKELKSRDLTNEKFVELTRALFNDLNEEFDKVRVERGVKLPKSHMALIKEFNQKANAINRLLENPLKPNWFEGLLMTTTYGQLVKIYMYKEDSRNVHCNI